MTPASRVACLLAALQRRGAAEIFASSGAQGALVFARLGQEAARPLAGGSFGCGEIPFLSRDWALFSPDLVISVEGGAMTPIHDERGEALALMEEAGRAEPRRRSCDRAVDYDLQPELSSPRFARTCEWVGATSRRLTVARRIPLPEVDPVATFALFSPSGRERALFRSGSVRYVGCSPELLAEGTREDFSCHKLSGTAPPGHDMSGDERLLREHESSVESVEAGLSRIGAVHREPRRICALTTLQHFETTLRCRPGDGVGILDCIEAVRPVGAHPRAEGLAFLSRLEEEPRGHYYGLSGFILPGGRFSFSQLIRTLFCLDGAWYATVGAAVTAMSTPALELEETRLKLSSIRFVPA